MEKGHFKVPVGTSIQIRRRGNGKTFEKEPPLSLSLSLSLSLKTTRKRRAEEEEGTLPNGRPVDNFTLQKSLKVRESSEKYYYS